MNTVGFSAIQNPNKTTTRQGHREASLSITHALALALTGAATYSQAAACARCTSFVSFSQCTVACPTRRALLLPKDQTLSDSRIGMAAQFSFQIPFGPRGPQSTRLTLQAVGTDSSPCPGLVAPRHRGGAGGLGVLRALRAQRLQLLLPRFFRIAGSQKATLSVLFSLLNYTPKEGDASDM